LPEAEVTLAVRTSGIAALGPLETDSTTWVATGAAGAEGLVVVVVVELELDVEVELVELVLVEVLEVVEVGVVVVTGLVGVVVGVVETEVGVLPVEGVVVVEVLLVEVEGVDVVVVAVELLEVEAELPAPSTSIAPMVGLTERTRPFRSVSTVEMLTPLPIAGDAESGVTLAYP
jgi:hypothetical protein